MDADAVVTPPPVAGPLRLAPFRALALAPGRIGDPGSMRAFARPYRDVAARFARWERRGEVSHDAAAALYLHEYTAGGITVRGLVGALDLTRRAGSREEAVVLPHEGVHPAQASELADRMAEMGMNPAPILLVHRGSEAARAVLRRVQERAPDREFRDRGEQQHRVWSIRAPEELAALTAALSTGRVLIADGHHRYAAYLRLRELRPGPATDAGLAMIVDQEDTPLFLGAVHRVLPRATLGLVRTAAGTLALREESAADAIAALGPRHLVVTDGRDWAVLELAHGDRAAVEILHEDLVPRLPSDRRLVAYHHSVEAALSAVGRRRGVAVLMPALDFAQLRRITDSGRLLPEKATSFQPKPSVGVLIRSLHDG